VRKSKVRRFFSTLLSDDLIIPLEKPRQDERSKSMKVKKSEDMFKLAGAQKEPK
jgi:hypothetical protein